MDMFAGHLFRATWQQDQFWLSKENMPPRSAVLVADFAENYACAMTNEVQSYHWSQIQITTHPVMAFVNATDEKGLKPTNTEAIFCITMITDAPKHDASAFMLLTNNYLKEKSTGSKVKCSSQTAALLNTEGRTVSQISFS